MTNPRYRADAFPSPGVILRTDAGGPYQQGAYAGMTRLEFMAAAALQGMLANRASDLEALRPRSSRYQAEAAALLRKTLAETSVALAMATLDAIEEAERV